MFQSKNCLKIAIVRACITAAKLVFDYSVRLRGRCLERVATPPERILTAPEGMLTFMPSQMLMRAETTSARQALALHRFVA